MHVCIMEKLIAESNRDVKWDVKVCGVPALSGMMCVCMYLHCQV